MENNLLPIRIYEQTNYDSPTRYITAIKNGYIQDFSSNKMFKLGPLKLLGDGSLGARTAKLKKPYSDDPSTSGISNFAYEDLYKVIKESHINKIDVAVNIFGPFMQEWGYAFPDEWGDVKINRRNMFFYEIIKTALSAYVKLFKRE